MTDSDDRNRGPRTTMILGVMNKRANTSFWTVRLTFNETVRLVRSSDSHDLIANPTVIWERETCLKRRD